MHTHLLRLLAKSITLIVILGCLFASQQTFSSSQTADIAYGQALTMLEKGHTEQARQILERVVLLNPAHAGAWLDLAFASVELGDYEAAFSYARHVLNFNNPPEVAQTAAKQLLRQLQTPERHHAARISLQAGHTNNANGGANIDKIGLTTDLGRLYFDLAESARAEPAWFTQLGGHYQTRLISPLESGPLFTVGSRIKRFSNDQPFQYQLQGSVSQAFQRWDLGARAALAKPGQQLDYARAGSWIEYAVSPRLKLGTSIDSYHHWYMPELNKGSVTLYGLWQPTPATQIKLLAGHDSTRAKRPGGDQNRIAISAFHTWPVGKNHLSVRAEIEQVYDHNGYNPLLEHNARRTLKRNTLEVHYTVPVSRDLSFNMSMSGWYQNSNIDLFRSRGLNFQAGLGWRF